MKARSFILTLTFIAAFLIVALPLVAENDPKYNETIWDECIGGSGSITKSLF